MICMSIAGVNPSGGAGMYADIKTFQAIGVYGAGVVTSLTAQNPYKFFSSYPVETEYISEQIDSVLDVYDDIKYVKTGMLYSKDIIKLVANKIKEYDLKAIVDPVMVATSGGILAKNESVEAYNKYLLPKSILTTPNISEAEQLTKIEIKTVEDAEIACKKLVCDNIITGGHLDGVNTIFTNGNLKTIKQEIIETKNIHGSGCTLSSAITAYLALGEEIDSAIEKGLDYTYNSILNGDYGTLIAKL